MRPGGETVLISLLVLVETERVLRSHYGLAKAEIAAALLSDPPDNPPTRHGPLQSNRPDLVRRERSSRQVQRSLPHRSPRSREVRSACGPQSCRRNANLTTRFLDVSPPAT